MKSHFSVNIVPVVIVGKDRTRMTCAVIDHIKAHINNATPFFICVSDRSRAGHDEVIRKHLHSLGETKFEVLHTMPDYNCYGWGAAINLGLHCAFRSNDFNYALVVDNDWLLQRDLDIEKYAYVTSVCDVGAVTFKQVNEGTNVDLTERIFPDIGTFLYRSKGDNARYSFTAEIGCMFISKRMYNAYGQFKENCTTDETEWAFCDWYNGIPDKEKDIERLWFATDKALFHENLNGEGHVFTHVGLHSQHQGPHRWEVPEKYLYLSDDEADSQLCHNEWWKDLHSDNAIEDFEMKIEWEKYFDRIFCLCHLSGYKERLPRLKAELQRVDILASPIFEWSYGIDTKLENPLLDDKGWSVNVNEYKLYCIQYLKVVKQSLLLGYERILIIEDDIAFLKDKRRIVEMLDAMPDTDGIQFDKFIWLPSEYKEVVESCSSCEGIYFRTDKMHFTASTCNAYNRSGMQAVIDCIENRKYCTDHIGKVLGNRLAIAKKSMGIQVFYKNSKGSQRTTINSLHNCYRNAGIDECYSDYNVPEGYSMNSVYDPQCKCEVRNNPSDITIDWAKYVDKIYCVHCADYKEREKPLLRELKRVDILDSGIFEMRITHKSPVFESVTGKLNPIQGVLITSLFIEECDILADAKLNGYDKILIIEDDAAFLKDKHTIISLLENVPKNSTCIQLSKWTMNDERLRDNWERAKNNHLNEFYVQGEGCEVYSAAAFILQHNGIALMESLMCKEQINLDALFHKMPGLAISITDMVIQKAYTDNKRGLSKEDINIDNDMFGEVSHLYQIEDINPIDIDMNNDMDLSRNTSRPTRKGRKFVSVYAIAKNEASVAKRWYECVKEADEVCVLDTGSTDDTVNILRALGAKVEVKSYDDWSFAVARNDSMKLVSPESEILFTLDLDETIAPGWRKRLEDAWIAEEEKGNNPVGAVYKYIWSFYPDGKEAQSFSVRKIHANGKGKWKYRCHELLTEVDGYTFFLDGFVVEHHQNTKTNRSKYLPLLKKDAEEMPQDDRSAYYYARELMYCERWHDAITEFKRHLELNSAGWICERASSMRSIAFCYKQLKSDAKCELWLWKSAEEDPTNREATFRLGEMAMERKDYRTAVKVLARCMAIEKPSLEYISDPTVWSAKPAFLYAQALWWTSKWDEAVEMTKKALEIEPNNKAVQSQYEGMKATRDAESVKTRQG